jgi:lipoprotein-releasing system permease protein
LVCFDGLRSGRKICYTLKSSSYYKKGKEIMNLSLWLAWRYLFSRKKDKNISFMIKICFLGIFIGTFALMLTLIITNGFEKVIHEKMQGITSQAVIYAPGRKLDDKSIKSVLKNEFGKYVQTASSNSTRQVIIDRDGRQTVLFLKGVEPETEALVSSISKKIIFPVNQEQIFSRDLKENHIFIGYKTAEQYKLTIGDQIKILVPEPGSKRKIYLNKKKVIIKGIFKIGLDGYDSNFAYCNLEFLKSIFKEKKEPSGADQISLKFTKPPKLSLWRKIIKLFSFEESHENKILKKLKKRLMGLAVSSWKELYPALVSSLKLEKYVMFCVLALITLVACMNMISLLFMQIQQKRRDIAIFKTMGMGHRQIKRLFLLIGLSITFFASIIGLSLAALAGYFLERYPFIPIPDVYYISYLPARMDPEIFVVVFASTMLIGFLATWIPARQTKNINIVDVLRQE